MCLKHIASSQHSIFFFLCIQPSFQPLVFPHFTQCAAAALVKAKRALQRLDDVDASRTRSSPPVRRVAYHKTRKTGSTTLGNIFFRRAANQNLTLFRVAGPGRTVEQSSVNPLTSPADMSIYHFVVRQQDLKWKVIRDWYKATVPGGELITIIREPVSHYVSYYYFFIEPVQNSPTLRDMVEKRRSANSMMKDFAVNTQSDLDDFLKVSQL